MKILFVALCGLIIFGINAKTIIEQIELDPKCAHGPAYWCKDLANAKSCGAVPHCIQTVWEKQIYAQDTDSICKICLDMVKQARDQLRSNETQEELKEVFEGTCEFIRVKKVRHECDKLADDFVPELIEVLSSQMDPNVVCSVSGLCNNLEIDKELAKAENQNPIQIKSKPLNCQQCNSIGSIISTKFRQSNRDDVLQNLLSICGEMSSLSDGCSAIILSYFNEIYDHLNDNLRADNLCHMAGVCTEQYHQHEKPNQLQTNINEDIPCELCKQLIVHLRDLLVANTTESEFKIVLEGMCKQTKSFRSECLSLADQYYMVIYDKLTHELNPDGACFMIGICPKTQKQAILSHEVMPLIPTSHLLVKKKLLGDDEPKLTAQQIESFQLPKDVLLLNADQVAAHVGQKNANAFCTLCEYFLRYVQDALSTPSNEEQIKQVVRNACDKLKQFKGECDGFVNTYGDAIIALLIQEIDPTDICPRLGNCIRNANEKCPLCLFFVQDIEKQLEGNKTQANIEKKLHTMCDHLLNDLKVECNDFVHTYTSELVNKLATDFTPMEICLDLKCCTPKEELRIESLGSKKSAMKYLSNEYEIESETTAAPECLLCEKMVKEVEKKIAKSKSKEQIKKVLEQACTDLPRPKLRNKCLAAIEKNSDLIVDLIIKEITPKEVCAILGFCIGHDPKPEYVCRICKIVIDKIEETINNKTTQEDIEKCVKHVCYALPTALQPDCKKFIDAYANEIIKHLPNVPSNDICKKLHTCNAQEFFTPDELDTPECILCEQIIKKVEQKVGNDQSKEHIKVVLEQSCSTFKEESLKKKCILVVEQNSDFIVDSIIKKVDSKEICHGIGFCDGPSDSQFEQTSIQMMNKYSETPQCVLCELLMTKIEQNLKNNRTEIDIENSVRKVCHLMPTKIMNKCEHFISDYAELIISMLSTIPPQELCGQINMCREHQTVDTAQSDVLECGVCNSVVDALSLVLSRNGPKEQHIVTETTCNLVSAKYHERCLDLINIYGISMTKLIQKSNKKSEICGKIGKCFNNGNNNMFVEIKQAITHESMRFKRSERLVGAKKCTYGPSYWCSSDEAKTECNAHDYCQKKAMGV